MSIRGAATREADLTLREEPLLPTQAHFDTGTAGFRIRTTFLSPPPQPGFPPITQHSRSVFEGVSAFCCPLLATVRFAMWSIWWVYGKAAGGSGSCCDWITALSFVLWFASCVLIKLTVTMKRFPHRWILPWPPSPSLPYGRCWMRARGHTLLKRVRRRTLGPTGAGAGGMQDQDVQQGLSKCEFMQ